MGRTAYTEPQCLYKGDLYLYLTFHIKYYYSCAILMEPEFFNRFFRNVLEYEIP